MSFIFENEKLLSQFVRLAQTATPEQNNSNANVVEVAKQLVQNLQNELAGGFSFTADRADADLSQAHVVNADELLNFLEFNGVRANGKNLVLNARQWKDDATGKMTNLVQSMGEAGKAYVPYPAQGAAQYYLYRDGFVAFLKDLEEQAANNPMLKAIVTKLRGQLSSALPEKVAPHTEAAGGTDSPSANPQSAQQNQQQRQQQQATIQSIAKVISALPFALNEIDFNRIEFFFQAVEPLMTQVPQTGAYITDVRTKMQNFSVNFTNHQDKIIPLGININQFANMLKQKGKAIYPAIDALDEIIDGTRAVIEQFNGQYGANLSDTQRAYIYGQIGKTPNDNSIYSRNARALYKLRGTPTLGPAK